MNSVTDYANQTKEHVQKHWWKWLIAILIVLIIILSVVIYVKNQEGFLNGIRPGAGSCCSAVNPRSLQTNDWERAAGDTDSCTGLPASRCQLGINMEGNLDNLYNREADMNRKFFAKMNGINLDDLDLGNKLSPYIEGFSGDVTSALGNVGKEECGLGKPCYPTCGNSPAGCNQGLVMNLLNQN